MRQRKRKLEAIKGNTVKALSFTESYGLTADTLKLLDGSSTKQWNNLVSQRLMGLIGTLKWQFERR